MASEFTELVDSLFFAEDMFDQRVLAQEGSEPAKKRQRGAAAEDGAEYHDHRPHAAAAGAAAAADSPCPASLRSLNDEGANGSSDSDSRNMKEEVRRERNRRHARETRLRKKEYVESLKNQLEEMSAEKSALEREIKVKASADEQLHATWFSTVQNVLALRASASTDLARWRQFCDENIVLAHPLTPYRSFRPSDVIANRCVLMGFEDIIQDASSLLVSLASLCKSAVHESHPETKIKVQLRFRCDDQALHFSSTGLMCPFEMMSTNLAILGLRAEVTKRGCLRATFNPEGKVKQLDLFFDPISFWRQIQQASGSPDVLTVPNTLEAATRPSQSARVITEATRPFRITHVNEAWTQLCGFTEQEACGETLTMLQGEETDLDTVRKMSSDAEQGRPTSMATTNYDKDGNRFKNFLQVYPLTSNDGEGEITHLLGVLTPLGEKF